MRAHEERLRCVKRFVVVVIYLHIGHCCICNGRYSNYWDKSIHIDIVGTIVTVSAIVIVACIYKIYGKTIIPKSGTIVMLLGIFTLIVMLGNSEIYDFPGQMFPSLMMTMGCICLAFAFLWRYASIILFVVFFEETIRKGCYLWLDVPFNAHVLSAIS